MKLKAGAVEEYRRRHDLIWPELVDLLRDAGIYDYSIFLDRESLTLFAVLKLSPDNRRDALPEHPLMQRWWTYMADLMETCGESSDGSDGGDEATKKRSSDPRPKEWPLELMFHMD
jgi:L-rhamnose mutarotase